MRDHLLARLSRPGSATHLALVRIVFAAHVLTVLVSPSISVIRRVAGQPLLLGQTLVPPGVERWMAAGDHIEWITAVGVAACLLTLVGLFTRVALPILAVAFFLTQSFYYRYAVFHDDWLYFNFFLLVLCCSRSADALSLDARLRRRPRAAPEQYRWPVELMIGWLALVYVAAATAKLFPLRKGLVWLDGGALQHFAVHFYFDSPIYWVLHRPLFDYSLQWPFVLASAATLVVESSAALLWLTRRFDAPVMLAILTLHVGIACFGIPGFVQIALVSSVLLLRPRDAAPAPAPAA